MENKSIKAALFNLLFVLCVAAVVSMFFVYVALKEHERKWHIHPPVQKAIDTAK